MISNDSKHIKSQKYTEKKMCPKNSKIAPSLYLKYLLK